MNFAFPEASLEITLARAEREELIAMPKDDTELTLMDSFFRGCVCFIKTL